MENRREMRVTKICLCLMIFCRTQTEGILQPNLLVTAHLGQTVTLKCFFKTSLLAWYKQTVGQKPQLIATAYKYNTDTLIFYHEFEDNPRFTVQSNRRIMHLTISKTQPSDSAIYYCGKMHLNAIEFEEGTVLSLKGSESNSRTIVQQPVSDPLQPEDSVTLQCTILTETCAGEHSVHWFRQGSGESSPGIIYTHGNRSDQCERSSGVGSSTQSCVYNLPKRNLSLFDSGTYYCAVATCGEILFGNGTKLDIVGNDSKDLPLYCLVGALTLSVILNMILICFLSKRKGYENGKENSQTPWDPNRSGATAHQNQETEVLNYAAVSFTHKEAPQQKNRERMSKNALYSEVRFLQQD